MLTEGSAPGNSTARRPCTRLHIRGSRVEAEKKCGNWVRNASGCDSEPKYIREEAAQISRLESPEFRVPDPSTRAGRGFTGHDGLLILLTALGRDKNQLFVAAADLDAAVVGYLGAVIV